MILYLIWNDHVRYDIMIFFTIWYYDMIFWYYIWCYNIIYDTTLNWEYMALNIELRHLCQRQSTGDGWRNSIFKQAVRAMYVPKNDLFFAIFCAGLHPQFFLNIKLPFGGHRWRKSHSFAKIRLGLPTQMAQVPHTSLAVLHVIGPMLTGHSSRLVKTMYIYMYMCVCPCACWRRASTGPKCLATHISEPWKG